MVDRTGSLLRDLFADATVPIDYSLIETHQLDYYLATDASFDSSSGTAGYGILVETTLGERLVGISTRGVASDSTEAEYRALLSGLEELFMRVGSGQRIGVLVDRPDLARTINKFTTFLSCPAVHDSGIGNVPAPIQLRMRALKTQISATKAFRVGFVHGSDNPAHRFAHQSLSNDSTFHDSPARVHRRVASLNHTVGTADD